MLNINKKHIATIFVTMLIIWGTYLTGYADITPVSDRTSQIRDAIVAEVPGVDSAEDVTEAHLAGIDRLSMSHENITALKEGDFDGLTSMTWLEMGNNQISSLPADVFSGLSSLKTLILTRNQISSLPAGIFSDLTSIYHISLTHNQLTALPAGVFTGLSSLAEIHLRYNQISSLPADVFSGLSSLTKIDLYSNEISSLPVDLFTGLSSLTTIDLAWNQLNILPAGLFAGLSSLTTIELGGNKLTTLPTGLFSGLSSLVSISLYRNQLSSLPMGIFSGLSSLTKLDLLNNAAELSLIIELQQIGVNQFKAVMATGAPFTIVAPLNVANGSIMGGATSATIPIGSVESTPFTVIPTPGTSDAVSLLLGTLPDLPSDHRGYTLAPFNFPPEFVEGPSTIRTVAEDIHTGGDVGTAVSATDPYNDPLTYTLSGTDASSFTIDATTGQLRTSIRLDYETQSTYMVTVNVTDGTLNDSIAVTINVTDVEPEVLNAGEPRTVRLFYFLPNDRPYRQEVVAAMKTGMLEVQSFYAEQMAAHGHGNTTFTIETDAQGEPIVHRIDGDNSDSRYASRGYTDGEIARAFDTSTMISVIVMDVSHYPARGQGTGNKSSGWLIIYEDWDWFTATHELAHAFGLHHDFRDDTDVLSYGTTDRSTATLSVAAAEFLSVHPYFDSSIPLEIGTRPTVELVSPTTYPAGSESVNIRVRVRDDTGLHQAMLFVRPNNPFRGTTPELKMWQKLDGETDTTVVFNFDGRVPSDSDKTDPDAHKTLANANQHEISVMAVDTEGNWYRSNFITLEAGEAQEIKITIPLSDRTPQVRDAIVAAVPGVNSARGVTAAHLAAITNLDLQDEGITSLKTGDFDGLTGLTTLHLSRNPLKFLPERVFSGLSSLTTLYLLVNELTTLPAGVFDGLSTLTHLNLSNNELSSLPAGVFDDLSALITLGLAGNDLTSLSEGVFSGLSALTTLHLQHSSVASLSEGIFSGLSALTTLHLNNNSLTSLPAGVFSGLSALTTLNMQHNSVTSLPEGVFSGLSALTRLRFVGNKLTTLPDDMFEDLTTLTHLFLSGNSISDYGPLRRLIAAIEAAGRSLNLDITIPSILAGRTPEVRDAIVLAVPGVNSAEGVTEAHLAAITTLDVNPRDQFLRPLNLQIGDFSGLTALTTLEMGWWDGVNLPDGIFDGLNVLEKVNLYNSHLTSVPNAVLGLTSLKSLNLGYHRITSIPAGAFDQLTQLNTLILDAAASTNTFTSLPDGVFDNLTSLTYLNLSQNDITSLPDGAFDKLTSLERLNLNGIRSLSSLPVDVFDQMTSLTSLSLLGLKPTFLPDGIFSSLSSLTFLDLSYGTLSSLPAGIFSGLSSLTTLRLERNAVNPMPLTVSLERIGIDQFKAVAPAGAPFDMVLPITVTDGSISGGTTTLTILAGSMESEVLTVTRTPGATYATTVNIGTLPSLPENHTGYSLVKAVDLPLAFPELGGSILTPVSERTSQVRDAIIAAVPGVNSAVDVTPAHLAAITNLDLSDKSITSLKSGDFEGLTSLEELRFHSNQLTSLPEDIFIGLTSLEELRLHSNQLTSLPEDIFIGLTSLKVLILYSNQLTTLPPGIFNGLSSLSRLRFGYNQLTTLPAGLFDGLNSLTDLRMIGNQLSELPDGIFVGLTGLTTLSLGSNAVDPLHLPVSLEKIGIDEFKAVAPTGAPFDIVVPIRVRNGEINGGTTSLTIPAGSVESGVLSVARAPGASGAVSVWIRTLSSLPAQHTGYRLVKNTGEFRALEIFEDISEQIWSGTVTGGTWGNDFGNGNATGYGYSRHRNAGSISNPTFTYRGITYTIHGISISRIGNNLTHRSSLLIAPRIPECDKKLLYLNGAGGGSLAETGEGSAYGAVWYIWQKQSHTGWPVGHQYSYRLTLHPTVPDAPTVTAINEGSQVTLSYATPCDGGKDIIRHEYRTRTRNSAFGSWIHIPDSAAGGVNVASYTIAGVNNPQDIYYEVRAINEIGEGIPSQETSPSDRTPQVAEAILGVVRLNDPNVSSFAEITNSHLTGITALYLNGRNITSLKSGDFEGLTSLEELRLYDNQLTSLPEDIFSGLTALATLRFGRNQLTTLPAGLFDGLTSLTDLRMIGNQLTTLPDDIFEDLTALTRLYLSGNSISDYGPLRRLVAAIEADGRSLDLDITIPSLLAGRTPQVRDAIVAAVPGVNSADDVTEAHLAAIKSLFLSSASITSLKSGDFDGLSTLEALSLHENSLTDISPLAGLTSLTNLNLAFNDIIDLSPLAGLTSLTTLYLQTNSSPIDLSPLASLTSLTYLDLSDNSLTDISLLAGLTTLTTLELDRNNLIDISSLAGLTALTSLKIDTNNLIDISPLADLTALTNLFLSGNSIIDISPLTDLTALTWLRLSSNNIIDIAPLTDLTALKLLSLSSNNIIDIAPLELMTALTSVSLASNSISDYGPLRRLIAAIEAAGRSLDLDITIPSLLAGRTPQVRDAIVAAVPGVNSADDVTQAHLAAITALSITRKQNLTSLKAGDFDGLTALASLTLEHNSLTSLQVGIFDNLTALTNLNLQFNKITSLPSGIFDNLTALTRLDLNENALSSLPADIFDELTTLRFLRLDNNDLSSLPADIFDELTALENLYLYSNDLTTLPSGIFDNNTALTLLHLSNIGLSSLPSGIFEGLTTLKTLLLNGNSVNPLPLTIALEKVGTDQFKAVAPTGAPFDIVLPLTVTNGSINGGATTLTIPKGNVESEPLTITRTPGTTFAVSVNIGTLPSLPANHSGYSLAKSVDLPIEVISEVIPIVLVDKGVCKVGDILTLGESCNYPDTDAVFSVIADGRSQWNIPGLPDWLATFVNRISINDSMSIISTVNGKTYRFEARAVENNSWQIEQIGDRTQESIASGINIPDANLRSKIEAALSKSSGDTITITEMETLTSLNGQDSSISNLTGLETATNLTTLKLGNNSISNISVLSGLTKLTELQLWDNQISDLSDLSGLNNLTTLYIWGNNISDISHLSGLTGLTKLRLGENSITNISTVSNLTNLTQLYLNENTITDISAITGLTYLTELRIGDNTISDITPVQNLTNLEWLDMPNNSISDISAVQNLTSLVELYFQNNSVSDLSPLVANTGFGEFTELDAQGNPLSYPSIYTYIPALQAKDVYIDFDNRVVTVPVKISGDTQQEETGATLTQPFIVEVKDSGSVVFAGVPVTFAITAGGGTLSATNTTTDANGRAQSTLTLGDTAGTNTVTISLPGVTQTITFTATSTAPVVVYITPVGDRTSQVAQAILGVVRLDYPTVSNYADITATHLASPAALYLNNRNITTLKSGDFDGLTDLEELRLNNNQLTSLPSDIFSGLTSLSNLNLFNNQLSSLPDGIFEGLTSLTKIRLARNTVDPLPVTVSLEKVAEGQFKAVAPTGAPFDIVLPINVANGSITGGATTLTIQQGRLESDTLNVTRTAGTTANVTVDIGTLPSLPRNHFGYTLAKSDDLPLAVITRINTAPVFTDDTTVTRTVAENTVATTNIGTPIAATDTENDTLTYTLSGTDASAFDIDSTTGQLKTKTALDYETKSTYTVTITVSDGSLTDTITVTINVTDIDESVVVVPPTTNVAPTFTDGESTTRIILENTPADTNIGNPVNATDANNDTLTYAVGGVDAASFDIDSTTGQLKTKASLDYETKRVYSVTITVDDDELSDTITVVISVIDVNDTVLSVGFVPVADRTSQVRDAIVAAVPGVSDAANVTESQVAAITSLKLRSMGISSLKTGDFSGMTALTTLNLFRNQLSELPPRIFENLSALTTLRLGGNAVDPLPLIVSLQSVGTGEFKAVITTGAPFSMVLPIAVTNGSIRSGITSVTIPQGSSESASFTVIGTSAKVSFGTLPGLPAKHYGYMLAQSTVCNRTTEVADAIAAAVGVSDCSDVTEVDLATITRLDLSSSAITSLQTGDFDGMVSLRTLYLENNDLTSLPNGIFDDLVSMTFLSLNENKLTTLPSGIFSKLTSLTHLDIFDNDLSSLPNGVFAGLSALTSLSLNDNELVYLPGTIFSGLSSLTSLSLSNNKLTSITDGIFEGLTQLSQLHLSLNPNANTLLTLRVSLQKVGTNKLKAVVPSGAPFTMTIPVKITNGVLAGGATTITIPIGTVESQPLTITRTAGTVAAVTADIGTALPRLPSNHNGYALVKSRTLPLEVLPPLNSPPVFTEGASTTRTISENTATGTNIGDAITATDVNIGDTLTYTLSGTDAATFDIDSTTGQLTTKVALDYETKNTYSVTLTVSDSIATDTIGVTINILNVNEAPVFAAGSLTTHTVAENTAAGENIGTAYSATDVDGDTLTYSLSGQDAAAFGIDTATGQLKTSAALDYETKTIYSVTIVVSDSGLTDTITVTINITDVDELPAIIPVCQVGSVLEPGQSCTYPGTDIEFTVNNSGSGSFLSFTSGNSINIKDSVINGKRYTLVVEKQSDNSWKIEEVGTSSANNAPVFTDGETATRTVVEDTPSGVDIGTAVSATDADGHTIEYTLGGSDADKFSIDSTNGQLRTSAPLDYETKSTYTVTITANDGTDDTTITVMINVINKTENRAPVFTDGTSTSRSVAENAGSGIDIGSAVAATDADGDTLTYTLGGTDAASFSIDSTTGQLRTNTFFDYETKTSYTVTITVSDGTLTDSITVTINITDVDETPSNSGPVFSEGSSTSRTVTENTSSGVDIGSAVSATDDDGDSLSYSLSGTDAPSFSIDSSSGQISTSSSLNYETKDSYSVTVNVSDGSLTDSIDVTINVTDVNDAPVFTAGSSTTRSIAENTAANVNIGTAVSATDDDADTLTYTLGGIDAASFGIVSTTGQLQTKNVLDYENKASYSVIITASDGSLSDTITVTINVTSVNEAPTFTDGTATTREIAENVGPNINIGSAVTATDPDEDTLTYTLGGTDAASFDIDSTNGQLKTKAALDFETKTTYTVTISVTDGNGGTDAIDVTVNVTDLDETPSNNPPIFTEGTTATRSIAENSASNVNIGSPVAATDADENTLAYQLSGTDAASFSIDSNTGQLKTSAALNYETKSSYTVTITVTDGSSTDTITVTINVTDANDAPTFSDGANTTRSIAENTVSSSNIGTAVAATDEDNDTLAYTLGGTDAASFSLVGTSGQLQTNAALNYEVKSSYSVTISVTDNNGGTATINVTINVTDANDAPIFTEGNTATRSVAENTGSGQNIGAVVAATDVDSDDTLNYTLGGTDAASFSIVSTSGQLQTSAALDYETKSSYSVTITVSDGTLTDSISVTITVNDVDENRAPSFTEGASATRSVAENTGSGVNIGSAVSATDPDSDNTLTYMLGGTDAASFSINSTNGQLRTSAALDYEMKTSYSVTITVSDGTLTDSISVTINVNDVDENRAPSFTEGASATRSVAENTGSGVNIGSAVSATDPDSDNTLTYMLGGTDAASFSINSTNGQLRTNAALNYESKTSYSVTVSVSDGNGESDSITVTINVTNVNEAPSFTDGSSTTRSIAENTASGQNIGTAVAATDADASDTLNYTLGGTDAASFSINSTNGQLRTSAALNYESKTSYAVTVSVSDGNGESDSITVTINVTNVNEAPSFTDGSSTTRSIAENTASGQNIGTAVAATDADASDTLNYTLGGTDAASFSIVSTSGQLQTSAALDYETKTSYSVTITVSDGTLTDSISVTINVNNVDENSAPSFTEGPTATRSVAENTASGQNIGNAVAATDADASDTLNYTLGGTDAASFSIVSTSGQLQTSAALDYETETSYSVTVSVSDGNDGTDSITVTINVTDVDEATIDPPLNERTQQVQDAIVAKAGVNSAADVTAAHLAAITSLDLNWKSITSLKAGDFDGLTSLRTLHLSSNSISDISPLSVLTNLTTLHLSGNSITDIPELDGLTNLKYLNLSGNSITDISPLDGLTNLTTLHLSSNSITDIPELDGLTNLTSLYLSSNSISDISALSGLTNLTTLHLPSNSITDISPLEDLTKLTTLELPFNSITDISPLEDLTNLTTLELYNNSISDISPLEDLTNLTTLELGDTIGRGNNRISDISPLEDLTNLTTLYLHNNIIIDISPLKDLTNLTTLTLSYNNSIIDISALEDLTNLTTLHLPGNSIIDISPLSGLTNLTSLTLARNSISDISALEDLTNLTSLTLARNSISDYGPLRRLVAAIEADGRSLSLDITIPEETDNNAPVFSDDTSTTRSIAEKTAADTNIGSAVAATDDDGDTLNYTLGGTDAASFSIVSTSGQLKTSAPLDYETKRSFSVTISVSDGNNGTDSITVTINITDVDDAAENDAPEFTDGTSTTRSVAEKTAADTDIGTVVAATDADNDVLTYSLGGTDVSSFSIDTSTGQLKTNAPLDYETKMSYSVTVTVTDVDSGTDTIDVTINITDVNDTNENDAPEFTDGTSTTRSVAENTDAGENIGDAVSATDADNDVLTYTLGGTDAASFDIVSTSGQLQTKAALVYETKSSYTVTVTVTDVDSGSDSITVTINVTDVSEGTTTTYNVGDNIGTLPTGFWIPDRLSGASFQSAGGQITITFNNEGLIEEGTYTYTCNADGGCEIVDGEVTQGTIEESSNNGAPGGASPPKSALLPNFPNPFNPETWIPFELSKSADVTLTIYNMRGVVVRQLKLGQKPAGVYLSRSRAIHWDGRNSIGEKVAAGVYFYTLTAGEFSATRKMLIRK